MEMMAYHFSRLPYSDSLKLLEADIQHANALLVSSLSLFILTTYLLLSFFLCVVFYFMKIEKKKRRIFLFVCRERVLTLLKAIGFEMGCHNHLISICLLLIEIDHL